MDIQKLLTDHNIPYITEGHSRTTAEWVNTHCPFCSGQDYHLGIHESGSGSHCWMCGSHPIKKVLSALLRIPENEVYKISKKYNTGLPIRRKAVEAKVAINPFKYPRPNTALTEQYKAYLYNRGFDAEKIEKEWKLLQTGPVSFLDGISFCHRILIPILWEGKVVSFQTRDITDKSSLKYIACPKRREVIHHKNILYGNQEKWKDSVIIVEGVTDVWRLGSLSVATFGIEFKMEQVMILAKNFKRLYILFDDEPQAQRQAKKLAVKLKSLGKEVVIERIDGDPGSMNQDDADHLVRQLIKWRN